MNNDKEHLTIEDRELDMLFDISAQRRMIAEEIQDAVMDELRQTERKRRWAKWGKPIAFAFGLPLVIMAFVVLLNVGCQTLGDTQWKYVLVFPIVALLASAFYQLANFQLMKGQ
ncbi:MAG: hypothetical protein ACI3Y5_06520 [Prevotella sp.]